MEFSGGGDGGISRENSLRGKCPTFVWGNFSGGGFTAAYTGNVGGIIRGGHSAPHALFITNL